MSSTVSMRASAFFYGPYSPGKGTVGGWVANIPAIVLNIKHIYSNMISFYENVKLKKQVTIFGDGNKTETCLTAAPGLRSDW